MTSHIRDSASTPAPESGNQDVVEQREHSDRRAYSCQTMAATLLRPQRIAARRREDRRYPVVDSIDSGIVFLAVLLILLSCMDAMFTLTLINAGGSELNPVMNFFLQKSVTAFLVAKLLLTTIPAVILAAAGNVVLFNRFRARTALAALVGIYAGVIVYELGLLFLL